LACAIAQQLDESNVSVRSGPRRPPRCPRWNCERYRDLDEAAGAADAIACSGAAVCVGWCESSTAGDNMRLCINSRFNRIGS